MRISRGKSGNWVYNPGFANVEFDGKLTDYLTLREIVKWYETIINKALFCTECNPESPSPMEKLISEAVLRCANCGKAD